MKVRRSRQGQTKSWGSWRKLLNLSGQRDFPDQALEDISKKAGLKGAEDLWDKRVRPLYVRLQEKVAALPGVWEDYANRVGLSDSFKRRQMEQLPGDLTNQYINAGYSPEAAQAMAQAEAGVYQQAQMPGTASPVGAIAQTSYLPFNYASRGLGVDHLINQMSPGMQQLAGLGAYSGVGALGNLAGRIPYAGGTLATVMNPQLLGRANAAYNLLRGPAGAGMSAAQRAGALGRLMTPAAGGYGHAGRWLAKNLDPVMEGLSSAERLAVMSVARSQGPLAAGKLARGLGGGAASTASTALRRTGGWLGSRVGAGFKALGPAGTALALATTLSDPTGAGGVLHELGLMEDTSGGFMNQMKGLAKVPWTAAKNILTGRNILGFGGQVGGTKAYNQMLDANAANQYLLGKGGRIGDMGAGEALGTGLMGSLGAATEATGISPLFRTFGLDWGADKDKAKLMGTLESAITDVMGGAGAGLGDPNQRQINVAERVGRGQLEAMRKEQAKGMSDLAKSNPWEMEAERRWRDPEYQLNKSWQEVAGIDQDRSLVGRPTNWAQEGMQRDFRAESTMDPARRDLGFTGDNKIDTANTVWQNNLEQALRNERIGNSGGKFRRSLRDVFTSGNAQDNPLRSAGLTNYLETLKSGRGYNPYHNLSQWAQARQMDPETGEFTGEAQFDKDVLNSMVSEEDWARMRGTQAYQDVIKNMQAGTLSQAQAEQFLGGKTEEEMKLLSGGKHTLEGLAQTYADAKRRGLGAIRSMNLYGPRDTEWIDRAIKREPEPQPTPTQQPTETPPPSAPPVQTDLKTPPPPDNQKHPMTAPNPNSALRPKAAMAVVAAHNWADR